MNYKYYEIRLTKEINDINNDLLELRKQKALIEEKINKRVDLRELLKKSKKIYSIITEKN